MATRRASARNEASKSHEDKHSENPSSSSSSSTAHQSHKKQKNAKADQPTNTNNAAAQLSNNTLQQNNLAQPMVGLPIQLVCGTGEVGALDGPCKHATFKGPMGIALSPFGNLIIADAENRRLRTVTPSEVKIPPTEAPDQTQSDDKKKRQEQPPPPVQVPEIVPGEFDRVLTLAGSSQAGQRDGRGNEAVLHDPNGIAINADGIAYFCDVGTHTIRSVSVEGEVRTVAGSGKSGFADGQGSAASFSFPTGIAITPDNTLYVADSGNHRIRAVSPQGAVRTLCGCGTPGHKDGQPHTAQFMYPIGIAADSEGALFVTDRANHRVRKVTLKGHVTTLAGNGKNAVVDGKGAGASLSWPHGIVADPSPRGPIYVSDTFVFQIRRIQRDGTTKTISIGQPPPLPSSEPAPAAADNSSEKAGDGSRSDSQAGAPVGANGVEVGGGGDVGLASSTALGDGVKSDVSNRVNTLVSLALDSVGGFLYACEQSNNCVRRITLCP